MVTKGMSKTQDQRSPASIHCMGAEFAHNDDFSGVESFCIPKMLTAGPIQAIYFTNLICFQTHFDDVIGEPDGAFSDPFVWLYVNKAFSAGRTCCFQCLTYVCAIPVVFLWGFNFACINFVNIYSITPCYRACLINCACAAKFFSTCVHCWCDPCVEVMALMVTKILIGVGRNSRQFSNNDQQVNDTTTVYQQHALTMEMRGAELEISEDLNSHERENDDSQSQGSGSDDEERHDVYENVQK